MKSASSPNVSSSRPRIDASEVIAAFCTRAVKSPLSATRLRRPIHAQALFDEHDLARSIEHAEVRAIGDARAAAAPVPTR